MIRACHILVAILLPLCACQQAPQGQQGLGATAADTSAYARHAAADHRARLRADSLEALFAAKGLARTYDQATLHWVFPARTPAPACAPAHLAEKSIYVLATGQAAEVIERSTYHSGRAITVWDEDLLDKKTHPQCEALVWEFNRDQHASTCNWYTDGPRQTPPIGFLTPLEIPSTVADSLLRAWDIDPALLPR